MEKNPPFSPWEEGEVYDLFLFLCIDPWDLGA
jgi:hypothetical protein